MEETRIRRSEKLIPIIFFCLFCSGFYAVLLKDQNLSTPNFSSSLQEPSVLTVDLLENQSIGWFRARLLFNVTTDVPINMSYFISGIGNSTDKISSINSSLFTVSSSSSLIEVLIQPTWKTVPKTFQYQFTLFYINSTTSIPQNIYEILDGEFEIIMGIPLSLVLVGVLTIGIIFISLRSVRLREEKTGESYETDFSYTESTGSSPPSPPAPQSSPSAGVEAGKIPCPECKERIAEGSAFCPECGYHIPRFLRMKE